MKISRLLILNILQFYIDDFESFVNVDNINTRFYLYIVVFGGLRLVSREWRENIVPKLQIKKEIPDRNEKYINILFNVFGIKNLRFSSLYPTDYDAKQGKCKSCNSLTFHQVPTIESFNVLYDHDSLEAIYSQIGDYSYKAEMFNLISNITFPNLRSLAILVRADKGDTSIKMNGEMVKCIVSNLKSLNYLRFSQLTLLKEDFDLLFINDNKSIKRLKWDGEVIGIPLKNVCSRVFENIHLSVLEKLDLSFDKIPLKSLKPIENLLNLNTSLTDITLKFKNLDKNCTFKPISIKNSIVKRFTIEGHINITNHVYLNWVDECNISYYHSWNWFKKEGFEPLVYILKNLRHLVTHIHTSHDLVILSNVLKNNLKLERLEIEIYVSSLEPSKLLLDYLSNGENNSLIELSIKDHREFSGIENKSYDLLESIINLNHKSLIILRFRTDSLIMPKLRISYHQFTSIWKIITKHLYLREIDFEINYNFILTKDQLAELLIELITNNSTIKEFTLNSFQSNEFSNEVNKHQLLSRLTQSIHNNTSISLKKLNFKYNRTYDRDIGTTLDNHFIANNLK